MSAGARASLVLAAALAYPAGARADRAGFGELGDDTARENYSAPRSRVAIGVSGYLRLRGEALTNLDLDRGVTPSGQPLFPVPVADPDAQTLVGGDMRLRTDFDVRAPGTGVSVKVRMDVLDNLQLGSTPEGKPSTGRAPTPAGSPGQRPPTDALRIKRAYGEAVTPFGTLAAGRIGNHWGLGMLANGGDCPDCDGGDAADRIAFATPIAGHIWAAAFDISATGPIARRRDAARTIDLEPTDDVRTVTLVLLNHRGDLVRARRAAAGRATLEYGGYLSHRWQENDIPADYLPTAQPTAPSGAQVMSRGYRATAVDGWLRLSLPRGRIELEAALLSARVDQASLVPGVLFEDPVESTQLGAAVETDFVLGYAWSAGMDAGYASGDPAPGFGAFPSPTAPAGEPGELDAPQANPPFDNRVDNFRFHPDYRIDRILFREIIGTVTDAIYLRPHTEVELFDLGRSRLALSVAAVVSWAAEASSTPSGLRGLGIEIDPTLHYTSDNFVAALEHGLLFPLAGLDNPAAGLNARPAQLWRVRLGYLF